MCRLTDTKIAWINPYLLVTTKFLLHKATEIRQLAVITGNDLTVIHFLAYDSNVKFILANFNILTIQAEVCTSDTGSILC